jgi:hypothetical protein
MGSLYRRGEIWWMKYYENGCPRRESAGTTKENEAPRFLKEREGRVATGQPIIQRADRILYEEAVQDLWPVLSDYRVTQLGRGRISADASRRFLYWTANCIDWPGQNHIVCRPSAGRRGIKCHH